MEPRRLRAPAADRGALEEPPLSDAPARLDRNRAQFRAWDHDFQGRRAGRLRAMARAQVFAASRSHHERFGLDQPDDPGPDAPLVVTGHQPELFHPGVWVKNFAAAGIARERSGLALNLIVDNDTPKWASIRVPTIDAEGELRAVAVDFDDWATAIPYEDWTVANPGRFDGFADRVRRTLGGLIADPLIDGFWPHVREAAANTPRIGLRFAVARRRLEASWGVRNAEVTLGAVCETEAFAWFASHLLAHLDRFRRVHNDALDRYRGLYGIRSRNHPVPGLAAQGAWLEAPFWCWRAREPRRRPLLARQLARTVELRIAGESETLVELPLGPDRDACCAVEAIRELPARGIRLRTRALTTTMFGRLVLGDLFIHGIGGAKYDELGDEVVRGFFGIEPPAYQTLTMTLRPGLPADPSAAGALRDLERLARDLAYNPDRHLSEPWDDEARGLIEAKRRAVAGPQETRRDRVARFFEIRRINQALTRFVRPELHRLDSRREDLRARLRRNSVAASRESAFVLHSEARTRDALRAVIPPAFPG